MHVALTRDADGAETIFLNGAAVADSERRSDLNVRSAEQRMPIANDACKKTLCGS